MSKWNATIERYLREWPNVSGGKGDKTIKESETLSVQNQKQQMEFNTKLMGLFNEQFAQQKEMLGYINGQMKPIVEAGGRGLSDPALAAARTSATDTIAQQTQNEEQAFQANNPQDRDLGSGVSSQIRGAIIQSGGAQTAGAQNDITMQNEQLKNQNYWNAMNVLSGNAAQYNPLGYSGAATGAANSSSSAGDAASQASQAYSASKRGWFNDFMGGLGSGLGSGVGGALGGGMSKKLFPACWIARAVYGVDNPRWEQFRDKFFRKIGFWQVMYVIFGWPVSLVVKRSSDLKAWFRTRMERYLDAA